MTFSDRRRVSGMRKKLKTLPLVERYHMAQVGLMRMVQCRAGYRLPETRELDLGFPLFENNIASDAAEFLRSICLLAPECEITPQQIDGLRASDAQTCVDFFNRAILESDEANLQASHLFPEIKSRCEIYAQRLERDTEDEVDCLELLVRCMQLLSASLSRAMRTIEASESPGNLAEIGNKYRFLSQRNSIVARDINAMFYEIFLIDRSLHGDDSKEAIEALRSFQSIKHLGLYY